MSETSVFENARAAHEEIEQYEEALANTLSTPPNSSGHAFDDAAGQNKRL